MFSLRKDIERALRKYPSLQLSAVEEAPVVAGIFTAHNEASDIEIENYEVLIRFPKEYPYLFPFVTETTGKIPRNLSRHVKSDRTFCFANWQDEYSVCKNGITFTWFLDEILNTHLCREYAKEKTTVYPTGERSHGMEGIWEGYYDIFHCTDKLGILNELDIILSQKPPRRNDRCYCNSKKKYKACHEKIYQEITFIGTNKLGMIYALLKENYQSI